MLGDAQSQKRPHLGISEQFWKAVCKDVRTVSGRDILDVGGDLPVEVKRQRYTGYSDEADSWRY